MMFESMIEGMEGTREGRKSAKKYLKGVPGVDRETPAYVVREECKRNKLTVKAGKKAAKFEDKIDGREEWRIPMECWKGKKKNTEKKEREEYYQRNGYASEGRRKIESTRKMDECRAE
jgi:hypothetical protein